MTHRLVALVVTRDRLDQLQKTLAALLVSDADVLGEVIVVDNQSGDGTADWLAAHKDIRVTVLTQGANLGGAGGFEVGLAYVRDHTDADWVVMMDDDGRPAAGTLETFQNTNRATREAWVTAVRYPSGGICEMNRPWRNPFWSFGGFLKGIAGGRGGFHIDDSAYVAPAPTDIDGGSFVGLFWSRRAIEMAGLPQGRLFLYGDDVLYSLALRRAGGRVTFDPDLHFQHDCETFGEDDGTIQPLWKVYYMRRNQLMVYRSAAGLLFYPVAAAFALRWWMQAKRYAGQGAAYRALLKRAIKDGFAQRTDMTFDDVQKLAQPDR
ncbi:glycosyltransferase [Ascidiaceihabitans sp.]|uniref:glycosyltransferase n=1 Tax=Ascidiaceihabitans sp. TaxID=1872644 RepID=UPI00329739ED